MSCHPRAGKGAAACQKQPPASSSLTLGNSLQLRDQGISWPPQSPSPLILQPTEGCERIGVTGPPPGHPVPSSPSYACPGRSSVSSQSSIPDPALHPAPLSLEGTPLVPSTPSGEGWTRPPPSTHPACPALSAWLPLRAPRLVAGVCVAAGWPHGPAKAEDWPPPSFRPQPLPRQRCAAVT